MSALDDYFTNDDGFFDSAPVTTETSSAGTDWTGIFGKLLDTGATVAGGILKNKTATNPNSTKAAIASYDAQNKASTTTKILYVVGGAVVLVLVGWLVFKKR